MHYKEYKTILSPQNGMNIYRGCTHGCIYCDSRSVCYRMEHDFEDIEIKKDAPQLLEMQLRKKKSPCMIGTGAMCDPYIPLERETEYTKKCLEVILRQGCGVSILTKSNLILRDLPLLKAINERAKCVVQMTLTTFDESLCKIIEPNVCSTRERVEVLKVMQSSGIPTVVWLCPLLPFINDTEENLRGIIALCASVGVYGILNFGMGVTLREGDREYFYAALDRNFPGLKQRYIKTYGNNYEIASQNSDRLFRIFREECKRSGIKYKTNEIFDFLKALPENTTQMSLF